MDSQKKLAAGIIFVVVLSAFALAFIYGDINRNYNINTEVAGNVQTDASWVTNVNQML